MTSSAKSADGIKIAQFNSFIIFVSVQINGVALPILSGLSRCFIQLVRDKTNSQDVTYNKYKILRVLRYNRMENCNL